MGGVEYILKPWTVHLCIDIYCTTCIQLSHSNNFKIIL